MNNIRLADLRKEIRLGIEQADRGELIDGKHAFAKIRKKSAQRKREATNLRG